MINAHHNTQSGWADDRLMEAYDLIHDVMTDNPAEPEFRELLKDIERADDILTDIRRTA